MVAPETIRRWENRTRVPSGPAKRLIWVLVHLCSDPEKVFNGMHWMAWTRRKDITRELLAPDQGAPATDEASPKEEEESGACADGEPEGGTGAAFEPKDG